MKKILLGLLVILFFCPMVLADDIYELYRVISIEGSNGKDALAYDDTNAQIWLAAGFDVSRYSIAGDRRGKITLPLVRNMPRLVLDRYAKNMFISEGGNPIKKFTKDGGLLLTIPESEKGIDIDGGYLYIVAGTSSNASPQIKCFNGVTGALVREFVCPGRDFPTRALTVSGQNVYLAKDIVIESYSKRDGTAGLVWELPRAADGSPIDTYNIGSDSLGAIYVLTRNRVIKFNASGVIVGGTPDFSANPSRSLAISNNGEYIFVGDGYIVGGVIQVYRRRS